MKQLVKILKFSILVLIPLACSKDEIPTELEIEKVDIKGEPPAFIKSFDAPGLGLEEIKYVEEYAYMDLICSNETVMKSAKLDLKLLDGIEIKSSTSNIDLTKGPFTLYYLDQSKNKKWITIRGILKGKTLSSDNSILELTLNDQVVSLDNNSFTHEVLEQTNVTKMALSAVAGKNAILYPLPETLIDFSTPKELKAISEKGEVKTYKIKVNKKGTSSGSGNSDQVSRFVFYEYYKSSISNNDGTFNEGFSADTTYINYSLNGYINEIHEVTYNKDILRNRVSHKDNIKFNLSYDESKLTSIELLDFQHNTSITVHYKYSSDENLIITSYNPILNRLEFDYDVFLDNKGYWSDLKNNDGEFSYAVKPAKRNTDYEIEKFQFNQENSTSNFVDVTYGDKAFNPEQQKFWHFFNNFYQLGGFLLENPIFPHYPINHFIEKVYSKKNSRESSEQYRYQLDDIGRIKKIIVTRWYKSDTIEETYSFEYHFFYN